MILYKDYINKYHFHHKNHLGQVENTRSCEIETGCVIRTVGLPANAGKSNFERVQGYLNSKTCRRS